MSRFRRAPSFPVSGQFSRRAASRHRMGLRLCPMTISFFSTCIRRKSSCPMCRMCLVSIGEAWSRWRRRQSRLQQLPRVAEFGASLPASIDQPCAGASESLRRYRGAVPGTGRRMVEPCGCNQELIGMLQRTPAPENGSNARATKAHDGFRSSAPRPLRRAPSAREAVHESKDSLGCSLGQPIRVLLNPCQAVQKRAYQRSRRS